MSSGVIEQVNARGLSLLDGVMHRVYGERKRDLFRDLPAEIVEIGPGAGANLRYYDPGTRVIAIEPSHAMREPLMRSAEERGLSVDFRPEPAEHTTLPDASVDTVVSTLVLCSVSNLVEAIGEIRRILKPGGRFVFVEHVVAKEGTITRKLQRLLRRPWRFLFAGCSLERDTAVHLQSAGFSDLVIDAFTVSGRFNPVQPHISGVARR